MEYCEPIPLIGKAASRRHAAIKKASTIDHGTGSTFRSSLTAVWSRGTRTGPLPISAQHARWPKAGTVLDGPERVDVVQPAQFAGT
jgi:hypothetical protein